MKTLTRDKSIIENLKKKRTSHKFILISINYLYILLVAQIINIIFEYIINYNICILIYEFISHDKHIENSSNTQFQKRLFEKLYDEDKQKDIFFAAILMNQSFRKFLFNHI